MRALPGSRHDHTLASEDHAVPDLPFDLATVLDLDLASVWAMLWPALAIAALRMTDVSLNVFRTVFIVQERRLLASMAAAMESASWLAAAGIVFADMTPVRAAGFVAGVSTGTAIGVSLTRRLRLGMVTVRVYAGGERDPAGHPLDERQPESSGSDIARAIHAAGHGATVFSGNGYSGPVDMVLSTVRRKDADAVLTIARDVAPDAFAAIDNSLHPAPVLTGSTAGRV
jgi:uncharacterized protein YebE (UPF0316 family)